MRQFRSSGSVEGVVSNHDPYSDCPPSKPSECERHGGQGRPPYRTLR